MTFAKRPLAVIALLVSVALGGCGGSSSPAIPASSHLEPLSGSSTGQIVLSRLGAQRIGIQTVSVRAVPKTRGGPDAIIPYSAVIYAPSGQTYAFTNTGPLTYVEVPIMIDDISGNSAYLLKGPSAGSEVVSVGAEELYGVQTGVLAQT